MIARTRYYFTLYTVPKTLFTIREYTKSTVEVRVYFMKFIVVLHEVEGLLPGN